VYNKPETHVWQNARPKPGLLPEMNNTDSQNSFLFFRLYSIASAKHQELYGAPSIRISNFFSSDHFILAMQKNAEIPDVTEFP
jgi:hypothetical protein